MSCRATRATRLSITARASAAEKTRFATLAHAAGISESRLALMAIRAFVDEDGRTQGPAAHDPAAERVLIALPFACAQAMELSSLVALQNEA